MLRIPPFSILHSPFSITNGVSMETIEDYPGLFEHQVTDPRLLARLEDLRRVYLLTGEAVLEHCPHNRYRSLAMTALEASLLQAIQALIVTDHAARRTPLGFQATSAAEYAALRTRHEVYD